MFRISLFILILISSLTGISQRSDSTHFSYAKGESELKVLTKKLFLSKKENERFEANKLFLKIWEDLLKSPESMTYPFDSLKKDVSILVPTDKKFRIITWNVPKNDGTQAYFGFVQVNSAKVQKKGLFKKTVTYEYEVFPLIDKSGTVKTPETYVADNTKWFGMLYYEVIPCDDYYTLLGWDGNDNLVQRKFVDILYFRPDGTPVFGKDVFKVPKRSPKRAMFEYSSEIAMSLKYVDRSGQIVFSHLAPKDEGGILEGQYQYYGPDGSFDAYQQSKGRWVLKEDIDMRNAKSKNDNSKKPDPNKQKDLYSPKK